jgi:hypothetical protein
MTGGTRRVDTPLWVDRLTAELYSADADATELVRGLTHLGLNWRQSPSEWSVGQCIDHLAVANEVYLAAMERAPMNAPSAPVNDITPGWFGRWFISNYIEPSTKRRSSRAPRKIVPAVNVEVTVLDRFLSTNARARAFIHQVRDQDVNRVRFRNPFVPLIYFTIGTGLEILTRHERRHLLQAGRIRQSGGF